MHEPAEQRESSIAGAGAFATRDFAAGDFVMEFTGKHVHDDEVDGLLEDSTIRHTDDLFQISAEEYLLLDPLPLAVNHSCDPNCGIRGENTLVAICEIRAGEELSFDYSTVVGAENDAWTMPCRCGASLCRRTVGSILSLPPGRIAYYRAHGALPDFILEELSLAQE